MKKRLINMILIITLLSTIMLISTGCKEPWKTYPEDYKNVMWSSTDPVLQATFADDRYNGVGTIIVGGEEIDIILGWGNGYNWDMTRLENPSWGVMGGVYTPSKSDKLVIEVQYDKLFSGAYVGKEITLTRTDIETEE